MTTSVPWDLYYSSEKEQTSEMTCLDRWSLSLPNLPGYHSGADKVSFTHQGSSEAYDGGETLERGHSLSHFWIQACLCSHSM